MAVRKIPELFSDPRLKKEREAAVARRSGVSADRAKDARQNYHKLERVPHLASFRRQSPPGTRIPNQLLTDN